MGDFDEYEVLPGSPWNYALQVDRIAPEVSVQTRPVSDVPFDSDAAPVVLTMPAKAPAVVGPADVAGRPTGAKRSDEPPMSPVTSDQPTEQVKLIPFGSPSCT